MDDEEVTGLVAAEPASGSPVDATVTVTRLLLTPIRHVAPPGHRGDVVQISDGRATAFLLPDEFDAADAGTLRDLLSARGSELA